MRAILRNYSRKAAVDLARGRSPKVREEERMPTFAIISAIWLPSPVTIDMGAAKIAISPAGIATSGLCIKRSVDTPMKTKGA